MIARAARQVRRGSMLLGLILASALVLAACAGTGTPVRRGPLSSHGTSTISTVHNWDNYPMAGGGG